MCLVLFGRLRAMRRGVCLGLVLMLTLGGFILNCGCVWECASEAYVDRVGFYDVNKLRE